MSLDGWAAWAEIFGAVAVIASLTFLGFQVRAYTRDQRQHRRIETFEIMNTIHDFMSGPSNVSEIFAKAATDYNSLTYAERIRFSNMYSKTFNALELLMGMREDGAISKEELARFEHYLKASFNPPMIRHWWKTAAVRDSLTNRVRQRVDSWVKDAETGSATIIPVEPFDA